MSLDIKTVGIFGGCFDPPHIGHIKAFNEAKSIVNEVWVLPCWLNAHKNKITSFEHRFRMSELTFGSDVVKDYEKVFKTQYTADLIENLKNIFDYKFIFFVGEDQWANLDKWKKIDKLVKLCDLRCLKRDGISSSVIRNNLNGNKNLLAEGVYEYIINNKLYDS